MIAHHLKQNQLLSQLQTQEQGLSNAEAMQRLEQHGANRLPKGPQVTLWQVILHQFMSPIIYVLIAAAILSVLVHEYIDAIFIGLVIGINALIGAIQEWGAETQASALQNMLKVEVRLYRDGQIRQVNAESLVPGDVVLVESGMKVPADIRLLQSQQLLTEEAALTGESLPVEKAAGDLSEQALPVGDRSNMLHAGTTVMRGRGLGVVINTGKDTEIGQIATAVAGSGKSETPLLKRMERFAKRITQAVLLASVLVIIIGLIRDYTLVKIFFIAVALAVSAIPEGLPISMTIALSIGSLRMSRRHVIVRQLAAVEGLGSCTWIATDKTGTLTVDQQTVRQVFLPDQSLLHVSGEGYNGEGQLKDTTGEPLSAPTAQLLTLLESISICNEARLYTEHESWHHQGDAIDVALLALAYKAGLQPETLHREAQRVHEIPFESEHKYAAVYYRKTPDAPLQLAIKGAAEALLPYLPAAERDTLAAQSEALAAQGFRVLAVAGQTLDEVPEQLPELAFQGFIALIDPIKPEALDAVKRCHQAGIQVSMITGDHPATALAIAKELGIAHSAADVISGQELGEPDDINAADYLQKVGSKRVFARVSPRQKQQIVEALMAQGHFVAVTGDGVNDAPALKKAHIGVAMGYGTDVAKEAASIIVTDNNLSSLAAGVEEGRYTYANIRKMISLLVSCGAAEVFLVLSALLFALPLPFTAVQLLWLNLITNGLQDKALAFEKGDPELMKAKPRKPAEGIFDTLMIQQVLVAAGVMWGVCFSLWFWLVQIQGLEPDLVRNHLVLLMVFFQNFHALNCRSESRSFFSVPLRNNRFLILAIVLTQLIHIGAMYTPLMQRLLGISPLQVHEWLTYLALGSLILVAMEIFKQVRKRLPQS